MKILDEAITGEEQKEERKVKIGRRKVEKDRKQVENEDKRESFWRSILRVFYK